MNLADFNPWWTQGKVPPPLCGKKRAIFSQIFKYIPLRQILIISGLRRVGKTTLMCQIIQELISQGVDPYQIIYFSFDEQRHDLDSLINEYETDILRDNLANTKVYLFLDEIQKLGDWASRIKLLYDLNPNLKIIVSGSARITVFKGTRESLAGRFFEFPVKPLDFDEYLLFREKHIDKNREDIYEKEIKQEFASFLKTGGFVEAIELDEPLIRRYFRESLLERVVFVDIPDSFKLDIPQLLLKLLSIAASWPGLYLDYKSIGSDLKVDQRTVSNYILYLEYALLVQKLYNYSPNLITTEKKIKRLYLSNTAFAYALNPSVDFFMVLEQFYINFLEAKFFFRSPRKEEIDIIHVSDSQTLPIEVKIREQIRRSDIKSIFRFVGRNNVEKGLIITRNIECIFEEGDLKIAAIPYWKYWTLLKLLKVDNQW